MPVEATKVKNTKTLLAPFVATAGYKWVLKALLVYELAPPSAKSIKTKSKSPAHQVLGSAKGLACVGHSEWPLYLQVIFEVEATIVAIGDWGGETVRDHEIAHIGRYAGCQIHDVNLVLLVAHIDGTKVFKLWSVENGVVGKNWDAVERGVKPSFVDVRIVECARVMHFENSSQLLDPVGPSVLVKHVTKS